LYGPSCAHFRLRRRAFSKLDGLKPSSLTIRIVNSEHTVLEVLFPKVRAELLGLIFRDPPRQCYVRELMNMSGLALHTVQDELRKLTAIGLVSTWSNGYHRFYAANRRHALFKHLMGIVEMSDKLPTTKHSALRRPTGHLSRKASRQHKPRRLPSDRPARWHLFSDRAQRAV